MKQRLALLRRVAAVRRYQEARREEACARAAAVLRASAGTVRSLEMAAVREGEAAHAALLRGDGVTATMSGGMRALNVWAAEGWSRVQVRDEAELAAARVELQAAHIAREQAEALAGRLAAGMEVERSRHEQHVQDDRFLARMRWQEQHAMRMNDR